MDKQKLFELSHQLTEVQKDEDFQAWFSALKNEISFDFSILGSLSKESASAPVCFGFSQQHFVRCFSARSLASDPLFSAARTHSRSISVLMDPIVHPDYGKRLVISGRQGKESSMFLLSFGERQPSSDEINALYLLSPHLNMVRQSICENKAREAASKPSLMTQREQELLPWLKMGKSNWEISRLLNISERTVKYHLQNIYKKLGTHNRTHAVAKAIEQGWCDG
ncbi:response regulator transcription factor [Agarivorans sp. Z349TD_8]|uniref:helix-turn-helix transcriptional regulator n=1 Tax=Agarivorans sp. Z349TD_8 TaxID=3421434 RepID=UPI003D7D1152